jgi:hypothetical protein
VVSIITSAHPANAANAISATTERLPDRLSRPSSSATTRWVRYPPTISLRRLNRSTRTPACRLVTSHGSWVAAATPAMAIGLRVSVVASQGNATMRMPSAAFDAVVALNSLQ